MSLEFNPAAADDDGAADLLLDLSPPEMNPLVAIPSIVAYLLLGAGFAFSTAVVALADADVAWARESVAGSDAWLGGAVNAMFGTPPSGPPGVLLALVCGAPGVLQTMTLLRSRAARARR